MTLSEGGIAHQQLDWARVARATYRIDQSIRYEYASPITHLRHKLVISPRGHHGDQRRLSHALDVSPDVPARNHQDAFGNDVVSLEVSRVERSIAFALTSHVVRDRELGEHIVPLEPPLLPERPLAQRRLIRTDEALLDAAADVRATHAAPADRAQAIAAYVYREMTYTKGVTDVFTTGSVAFSMRRGVCQDYAHIAIALARACGLPARYVSGHLLGEGATHAWVEFLVPAGPESMRVIALDPTNGCAVDLRYIVVAIGRDYDDVAPTSGVFVGRSPGSIDSRQSVRVLDVSYAA